MVFVCEKWYLIWKLGIWFFCISLERIVFVLDIILNIVFIVFKFEFIIVEIVLIDRYC